MNCCTCHVYIEQSQFQDLLHEPEETERDMIDLAYEPRETSRLGCQIRLTPSMIDKLLPTQQLEIEIPRGVNNLWEP